MTPLKDSFILNNGTFQIRNVLGQGGFGITYLATDTRTGKSVALKEFFPRDCCIRDEASGFVTMLSQEMDKYKRKFISEANKIAKLNHRGIIKVLGVFEENGTAYYAMEYIAGQSLYELLKQRKFSLDESLKIIEKVSLALAHIHSKRMLHLDIKPTNIMMRHSDNAPIIIDFGISKSFDAKGDPNTTFLPAASPGYSPAEQFEGDVNTFAPQVDIYSLGATFYTLLTGKIPSYPTPLTNQKLSFNNNEPKYVVDAIKTAMSYDQSGRFANVNEFLTALRLTVTPNASESRPLLKFKLVTPPPYYIDENIDLSWDSQNCDKIYLNGKLQTDLRKSEKTIIYHSLGKKRLTLKAVKGDKAISRTIEFEILPRTVSPQVPEETKIIRPEIQEENKPVINSFNRSGTDKIFVGDEVSVYWSVRGADAIAVNGVTVPKTSKKKLVKVAVAGENAITLTASNAAGTVKKALNITVHPRQYPRIKQFDAATKTNIKVGDSLKIMWEVEDAVYVWLDQNEAVSAKGTKIIEFLRSGRYSYELNASNHHGTAKKTLTINVSPKDIVSEPKQSTPQQQSFQGNATTPETSSSGGGCFGGFVIILCIILGAIGVFATMSDLFNSCQRNATESTSNSPSTSGYYNSSSDEEPVEEVMIEEVAPVDTVGYYYIY